MASAGLEITLTGKSFEWASVKFLKNGKVDFNFDNGQINVLYLPVGMRKQGERVVLNKTLIKDERFALSMSD